MSGVIYTNDVSESEMLDEFEGRVVDTTDVSGEVTGIGVQGTDYDAFYVLEVGNRLLNPSAVDHPF